ncbi:protealysin inhibitor emfourin [Specibacter cremeus]|uniref:protealysin inhibitor emfourin n=1 Tax=Specibacter cremeus TaxID=1629051 RepID=UPI000F79B97F|nr:protealysin inhibitor emfourin [Specibacter cremeus]
MKLTVRRGGGLAGIVARTELDSAALAPGDRRELTAEVDHVGLRTRADPPVTRTWPDSQLYEISLEDGGRRYSLHYTDESLPEDVGRLLAWIDGRPERVESLEM